MNTKRALLAALIAGGLALTAGAADAAQLAGLFHKAPRASAEYAPSAKRFKPVNSGCGAAIARVEAQTGGKVISAKAVNGGEISDRNALIFAWVLGVLSIIWLAVTTNWLAAAFGLAAIFTYVVVYTLWLKRRSEQNIIWGGIAGCFPVVIGWAAVTGDVGWPAWVLFLVIFLWTPAHYWPLSMRYREDYAAAGVPMLGVVRGRTTVGLQIILYTWATVASSLLLIPIAQMGWVYTITAVASGAYFIAESHQLYSHAIRGREGKPMRVFHGSIAYLSVLSLAIAIDPLLPF